MAIALVDSDAVGIGLTSAGVVYNFPAGAPGATDLDIISINSDALINTPAGWTLGEDENNNQGSAVFYRRGGAGASVTVSSVQTPGPFNATLNWSRWSGSVASPLDVHVGVQGTGAANTTPAINSGALAETGELVYVFAALHSTQTSNQNTPVWSAGFNPLELVAQGTGGNGCVGVTGYKLNAGTAAETPTVTWSGDSVTDRYVMLLSFKAAVPDLIEPTSITDVITFGEPTLTDTAMAVTPTSISDPIVLGQPTLEGPPQPTLLDPLSELYTQALSCLCAITSVMPGKPPQHCAPRIGPEITYDMGQYADYCCEGLAYLALGDIWLSEASFPEQDIIRQIRGNCVPGAWAADLKLGIIRCSPVGNPENGEPPTDDDWTAAAVQNLYDAQALRRVACCIHNWITDNETLYLGMSVVINRQIQVTPNGGCVERYFTVTVQFPNLDCSC
jgi:hypothetical protein